MKLWSLQLLQRKLKCNQPTFKEKLMELDGVGFFYEYNKVEELKPEYIRKHLQIRESTYAIVESPTVTQAINTFHNEWDAAKVGGIAEETKALWIDREHPIREIAKCELLRKSKRGQFICGDEKNNGSGEFGMCILENYDRPDGYCGIGEYNDKIFYLDRNKKLPIKTIIIKGKEYKYYTVRDIEAAYKAFFDMKQEKLNIMHKPIIVEATK